MKETIRVNLLGPVVDLRQAWENRSPWPFDEFDMCIFPSGSRQLDLLRELLPKYPKVRAATTVERTYSAKELLTYPYFVLWVNGDVDVPEGEAPQLGISCPGCGFPAIRFRSRPMNLSRTPPKDVGLTDDWELVVSPKVAMAWEAAGLTGAHMLPTADGSGLRTVNVQADLGVALESLLYAGAPCNVCGRVDRVYARHPSKEIWIPADQLPTADLLYLNAERERTHNHKRLISNRAYRILREIKATGWWVQPVRTTPDTLD